VGSRPVGEDIVYASWCVSGLGTIGPIFVDGFDVGG
jgi:hypothetical protein